MGLTGTYKAIKNTAKLQDFLLNQNFPMAILVATQLSNSEMEKRLRFQLLHVGFTISDARHKAQSPISDC